MSQGNKPQDVQDPLVTTQPANFRVVDVSDDLNCRDVSDDEFLSFAFEHHEAIMTAILSTGFGMLWGPAGTLKGQSMGQASSFLWPFGEACPDSITVTVDMVEQMIEDAILSFELQERRLDIDHITGAISRYQQLPQDSLAARSSEIDNIIDNAERVLVSFEGSERRAHYLPIMRSFAFIHMLALVERWELAEGEEELQTVYINRIRAARDNYNRAFTNAYSEWKAWRFGQFVQETWAASNVLDIFNPKVDRWERMRDRQTGKSATIHYYGNHRWDFDEQLDAWRTRFFQDEVAGMLSTLQPVQWLDAFVPGQSAEEITPYPFEEEFELGPYGFFTATDRPSADGWPAGGPMRVSDWMDLTNTNELHVMSDDWGVTTIRNRTMHFGNEDNSEDADTRFTFPSAELNSVFFALRHYEGAVGNPDGMPHPWEKGLLGLIFQATPQALHAFAGGDGQIGDLWVDGAWNDRHGVTRGIQLDDFVVSAIGGATSTSSERVGDGNPDGKYVSTVGLKFVFRRRPDGGSDVVTRLTS